MLVKHSFEKTETSGMQILDQFNWLSSRFHKYGRGFSPSFVLQAAKRWQSVRALWAWIFERVSLKAILRVFPFEGFADFGVQVLKPEYGRFVASGCKPHSNGACRQKGWRPGFPPRGGSDCP